MVNNNLTLGSLFDGSGGFPLGGLISGITPVWASEIEPFPIRVTTKRLPQVKHYGDISKMNGAEIEPVDIITFGSPCQDMSIAGKRDGLSGSRSSLFYEAVRIIKEMRCKTNGQKPRFIVWENVPGAFSSNKGEDFRAVLEEVCKIKDESVSVPKPNKWNRAGKIMGDNYSVAWRQFDAQFWGVPQRRKRIYLVADFAGWSAGKILFESEGLSGYSKTSISSWQGSAATVRESTEDAGIGLMFENHGQDSRYTGPLYVSQTVLSTYGTGGNNQPFIVEDMKSYDVRLTSEGTRNARHNVYETDTSRTIDTGGNSPDSNQGGVAVVAYGICSKDSNSMKSANPNSGFYEADTSRTIDGNGGNPGCNQGGIV
nr:MAG TPA: Cytosine specific methyltransferase [Caudoviricetes sp.]